MKKKAATQLLQNQSSKFCWFKIPSKTRGMIIDKMDPKTRCIFTICSRFCELEAKKSKFFIYGISISEDEDGYELLKIIFDEFENGYWLKFHLTNTNQTVVVCSCLKAGKNTVIWTKLETGNDEEVSLRYLKHYLEVYKKQVQFFRFDCSTSFDFTLRDLENLKKIQICKKPKQWKSINDIPFIDKHELLQIETIDLSKIGFTSEDLFNFKGKHAYFERIWDFDEENCKKYLKMLKSGEISVNSVAIPAQPLDNMIFGVSTISLDMMIFRKIREEFEGVDYTENGIDGFTFDSEDRKYSVIYDSDCILKIDTIEVFKKLDQFACWPKLPQEIQEIVTDNMESKSRCQFAQCSKKSEKTAKRSKNYLYKIGVFLSLDCSEIQFAFSENAEKDFWLEFTDYEAYDQTIVVYKSWKNGEEIVKWTKFEDGEPNDVRMEYLNDYIRKYGRVIRYFHYDGNPIFLRDLDSSNFKNIDKIHITDWTEQDLDYLGLGYVNWEMIRRCKHIFLHDAPILTFQQLLELDPETADIECRELNEGDNFEIYLEMLKNGEVHRNLKSIELRKMYKRKNMSFERFGPFLKSEVNPLDQTHIFRSNFKNYRIIEVYQRFREEFGEEEEVWRGTGGMEGTFIKIKCYEDSEL